MKWRRTRRYLLIILAISLVAFCAISWFVAGALVAPANRIVGPPPDNLTIQTFSIGSESGSKLATWYMPNPNSTATIVLLHPIRGDRRSMLGRARLFHDAGFAILMVDLQAHGESPGDNITIGHLEKLDVRATLQFAREMNPNHRIGVVGRSLGGASTLLAVPIDIDALVLESVYPTIADAVYDRIGMRLGSFKYVLAPALLCQLKPRLGITSSDLRPIDFIDDIGCPVLIASGDRDEHTPIDETKQMFESAAEPKELVIFNGAKHVDLLEYDKSKYETEILGFMISSLLPKSDPEMAR